MKRQTCDYCGKEFNYHGPEVPIRGRLLCKTHRVERLKWIRAQISLRWSQVYKEWDVQHPKRE